MKKVLLLVTLLALLSTTAVAENNYSGGSWIGLFWDEDATTCNVDLEPYTPSMMYVYAVVNTDYISQITAAEFAFENLPPNSGYPIGTATDVWNTDLVIGDAWDPAGVALAFDPVEFLIQTASNGASYFALGTIDFMDFSGSYVAADTDIAIVLTTPSGVADPTLVLVDEEFEIFDVAGGHAYVNWAEDPPCIPNTPVQSTDWGNLKSLY